MSNNKFRGGLALRSNILSKLSSLFSVRAILTPLFLIILFALSLTLILANQTTLEYNDGTQAIGILHDANSTFSASGETISFGSGTYFDRSYPQSDVYARICHQNLEINSTVDFVYRTFSGLQNRSLLNLPLLVTDIYNTTDSNNVTINCTLLDVQFSASRAFYPGYINPVITTGSTHYYANSSMIVDNDFPAFNGTMSINLTIDSPPKSYWFRVAQVRDDSHNPIIINRSLLLTSIVSSADSALLEGVLRPGQILNYTGTFSGGERVVVNGITLFEVEVFTPCGEIRDTGYYILNNSMFNLNSSCINITDVIGVTLNFGGELLDGDADSINGSFRDNVCAVTVRNARNITFEGLATQEFFNGICIINSTVTIYGNSLVANQHGMYVTNDSNVYVGQTTVTNYNKEVNITNNSLVRMSNVTFSTANMSGSYYNVWLNDVPIRPTLPVITNYSHIDQFIEVKNNTNHSSWALIAFNYQEPLPYYVQTNQIYIYEYNGSYDNISTFDNITNTTSYSAGWTAENWTRLFTLVSPQQYWIFQPNVTSFSVFAPFGLVVPPPPGSNAGGSTGSSGGGGGAGGPGSGGGTGGSAIISKPGINFTEVIQLKLTIPANITLMQGEVVNIPFSVENLGNAPAYNVNVLADVPRGWKSSVTVLDQINPGEIISSVFSISVYEKVMPADYYIPVSATVDDAVVVSRILKVSVIPRGNLTRLLITEYNPVIDILPNSQKEVTFKAKNIGDYSLEGVTILLAPNDCIKEITGSHDFAYGEEKEITYRFVSSSEGNCQYTLKFVEGDRLVDFVPVTFQIRQLTFIEQTLRLLIIGLIVGVWFTVAVVIAFKKRRPPYQLPPTNPGLVTNFGSTYQAPNYNQYYRGN